MDPTFHGILTAPSITLNDQELTDVRGMVDYENRVVSLSQFGFRQGGGSYQASLSINIDTHDADGSVKVQDGDVNAIAAICNFKNEIVSGKVSSDVQVGGTYDNPELTITGQLADGKISGTTSTMSMPICTCSTTSSTSISSRASRHGRQLHGRRLCDDRRTDPGAFLGAEARARHVHEVGRPRARGARHG